MKNIERIPVAVDKYTKGRLVYAVDKEEPNNEWLVLIHSVNERDGNIKRHISVALDADGEHINMSSKLGIGIFCDTNEYDFYEPTEEEKKYFRNIMNKRKVKFVKILNKLIWR